MNRLSHVFQRSPLAYALLYVALSIAVEAVAMVVFRLQPPRDNRILAPLVLILPPLLAPLLAGFRRWQFAALAALTVVLTLVLTVVFTHFTKKSTGLLEPILLRAVAGWLAAMLVQRIKK